jgi:hypothetical protein
MINPLQLAKDVKRGFKKADITQQRMIAEGVGYGQSVLDPRFKKEIAAKGVSARETPAQFLGAYTSRMLIDVANDGTRTYWWRWNHPLAIAQRVAEVGANAGTLPSPTARALTAIGIAAPAVAAAGTYDITNPEEQFRPTGYAQTYSAKGTDDRRKTEQPVQELFERFFMGRTGDPLKYETIKQEIPDITPERYGNYLNYLYQDKGLLGLGVVKGTMENLQGKPELRMLGFPVSVPMAGGFVAGAAGARLAGMTGATPKQKALRSIAGGLAGSLTGVAAGNVVDSVVANNINNQNLSASQLNSQLPMS